MLPSKDSEAALLIASGGERQASSELVIRLFDQLHGAVLGYVIAFGLPFQDAEDVVQETFLSLFRHLELGRPRSNLKGWIYRVAHNLALKQRGVTQAFASNLADERSMAQQPCGKANPEDECSFNQTRERLRAVFAALPKQDQRCLYLHAEGLKYREIAEVLGISLGAVSLSLSRSFARILRAPGSG